MEANAANKRGKISELDGVRGIAIVLVLIWHYFTCQGKMGTPDSLIYHAHNFTRFCGSGVDLFFVLSGFLIGGIILDNHGKGNFLKVFWVRRSCRILPVLFLTLFACWVVVTFLPADRFAGMYDPVVPWWSYLLFIQNMFMGLEQNYGGHFLAVTWSLAVEEQFYLIAPLLMFLLGRKKWVMVMVPLAFLSFALRLLDPGVHNYLMTQFRLEPLALGILLAALYRNQEVWEVLQRNRIYVLQTFLGLLAINLCFALSEVRLIFFQFSWFALTYSVFILFALLYQNSLMTCILRWRALGFLGAISYALYMYHQPVSKLIFGWATGEDSNLGSPFSAYLILLSLGISILLAWVSTRTFEAFFITLGRRVKYHDQDVVLAIEPTEVGAER